MTHLHINLYVGTQTIKGLRHYHELRDKDYGSCDESKERVVRKKRKVKRQRLEIDMHENESGIEPQLLEKVSHTIMLQNSLVHTHTQAHHQQRKIQKQKVVQTNRQTLNFKMFLEMKIVRDIKHRN